MQTRTNLKSHLDSVPKSERRTKSRLYNDNWFERRAYEIESPNNLHEPQPPTPEHWDAHCRSEPLTRVFRK